MKQLTTELAFTIFGSLLVAGSLAGVYYFIFVMSAVPVTAPITKSYNIGVIANELLRTPPASNVFSRTLTLGQLPASVSGSSAPTYTAQNLGKVNLVQPE